MLYITLSFQTLHDESNMIKIAALHLQPPKSFS